MRCYQLRRRYLEHQTIEPGWNAARIYAPGGMPIKGAARCSHWLAINDNTPACSWWSGPGLLYALCCSARASVRCFVVREYRLLGLVRPVGRGRKNAACGSLEGLQAAGRWRGVGGHGQEKTRPRKAQGGRWLYSRFLCKLPYHHQGQQQNK